MKTRDPFYVSPDWLALRSAAIRRDGGRCVVRGCQTPHQELTVDHIVARQRGAVGLTSRDTLANLRTLCGPHDRSVKELPSGARRNGGILAVGGCDAFGRPLDPEHPWNRKRSSAAS